MNKKEFAIWTGLFLILFVVVMVASRMKQTVVYRDPGIVPHCSESSQRKDGLGNIYTCIGDEWIYTGNINDDSK